MNRFTSFTRLRVLVAGAAMFGLAVAVSVAPFSGVYAHSGEQEARHTVRSMHDSDNGDTTRIMVMKHLCRPDIQSEEDFEAVESLGNGNPVAALAQTVLACPTIRNPGDAPAPGSVAGPNMDFAFTIRGGNGRLHWWNEGVFKQHKLCESDLNVDANGDGVISPSVCLDVSHYEFDVSEGFVKVLENNPPAGARLGALRFTPTEVDGNNDEESLRSISFRRGLIRLHTRGDNDGMIMLHVYNFQQNPDSDEEDDDNTHRRVWQRANIRSHSNTNVDVDVKADSKSVINVRQSHR